MTRRNHDRVLAVVRENAASLLRLARRNSLCGSDAEDAYQRALVIYLERVERIDDATAGAWLRTVVKHEAMAIREQRQRALPSNEVDFDGYAADVADGDERILRFDRVTRAAEALQRCKADEVTALMLKAEGNSYDDIGRLTGWSYTKVNRCLSEGRQRFLKTYAAIETGRECERLAPLISAIVDGEASAREMEQARPHLRNCAACRATMRELHDAQPVIRVVVPAGVLFLPFAAESGVSVLTRLYEQFMGGVQESALRVQAAIEAVGSGKAAAVAASAAALAGGGMAANQVVLEPERDARAATLLARATPTPHPKAGRAPEDPGQLPEVAALEAAATPAPVAAPRRTPEPEPTPRATATPAAPPASEGDGEFFGGGPRAPRRSGSATTISPKPASRTSSGTASGTSSGTSSGTAGGFIDE